MTKSIILFICLLQIVFSIQTSILQHLTKNDQQSLVLAKEMLNILESQKTFNKEPFTCLSFFPTNVTKNHKETVHKLNLTYNYKHQQEDQHQRNVNKKNIGSDQQNEVIGVYEDWDYDKILDLLHGSCAIHETASFLYEYCHKQKVRQFDDIHTRQRMVKPHYEDIAMGYFNYQEALINSRSQQNKALKPGNGVYQIKYSQGGDLTIMKKLLDKILHISDGATVDTHPYPQRSVIYDENNLFTVDTVNHKEYDFDREDRIIRTNYPLLKGNTYFTTLQLTHEVTCQNHKNGSTALYVTKAVVLSPFQLAFLGDVSMCDKVIDISFHTVQQKIYDSPSYFSKFRFIDNFAYGDIDKSCTNNWDWSMNSPNDFLKNRNNHLEAGTTLLLEMAVNVSGKVVFSHFPVTVQKIIAQGVVKLQEKISQELYKLRQVNVKDAVWVNGCRVISKKPINKLSFSIDNKIMRRNLIKISQSTKKPQKKPGDQMLCLCRYKKLSEHYLQMHLQLGNKIIEVNQQNEFVSYYQFYQQRTVKTTFPNDKDFYQLCSSLICYDVIQNKQQPSSTLSEQNSPQGFTSVTKLTHTNPITEGLDTQNQIIILDVSENGIIKIHTEKEEEKYFYLISTSFLFKFRLFPNGTKEIVSQNSFYENQTSLYHVSWFSSSLFIHKGYMWRGIDKIVFPRMDLGSQTITQVQRVSGYAYIRKLDLSKMKHKDSHMLSDIKNRLQDHFQVYKFPLYQSEHTVQEQRVGQLKKKGTPENQQSQDEESVQQIELNNDQAISPDSQLSPQHQKLDLSNIDFSQSNFKPLNKSVSVRYQYFHGDYCGNPINKYRRTNVDLQCGDSWLKIQQVTESSPCVYEMKVSTRLLCRQGYQKVVQRLNSINKISQTRVKLDKGVVCYPQDAWDNALFVYDVQNRDVYYNKR